MLSGGRKPKGTPSWVLNLGKSTKKILNVMGAVALDESGDTNSALGCFGNSAESRNALQLCLVPFQDNLFSQSDNNHEEELKEDDTEVYGDTTLLHFAVTLQRLMISLCHDPIIWCFHLI